MEPLSILTPPVRKSLIAGVALSLGGLAWSIWAQVPIEVKGSGVLSPIRGISRTYSPSEGVVTWRLNSKKMKWHYEAAEFIASSNKFNTNQLLKLSKSILDNKAIENNRSRSSYEYINSSDEGIFVSDKKLLAWIRDNSRLEKLKSAYIESKSILENSIKETVFTKEKLQSLSIELNSQSSYLSDMKGIRDKGYVSKTRVYDQISKVDGLKANILDENNKLLNIKNKNTLAIAKLRSALSTIINNGMIFSKGSNFIWKIVPSEGAKIKVGELVLLYSRNNISQPEFIPIYVNNKDSASVKPGMKTFVIPKGYSQLSDGAIEAVVYSVNTLPSELNQIQYSIGLGTEAKSIFKNFQSPTLIILKLSRLKNKSKTSTNMAGYKWATKNSREYSPKTGQFLNAKIITSYKRPIEFLMPNILTFFGLSESI